MVRINDLNVDRSLLIKNFGTYQLSLDKFHMTKAVVPEGVQVKQPNDDQYSFLHHKEFSLHNHLYRDVWSENCVYLITSEGKVKRALINIQTDKLFGLADVWEIPRRSIEESFNFNASISFASGELAVITDGFGYLYIIDTSNRSDSIQWKLLHTEDLLGAGKEFKISCSNLEKSDVDSQVRKVDCVLLSIEKSTGTPISPARAKKTSGYETVLKWISFTENCEGKWEKSSVNELRGNNSVDYICLDRDCQGLYIISESEFHSANDTKTEETSELSGDQLKETETVYDYQWQQSNEDVLIWINITSCTNKSDLKIIAKSKCLEVRFKDTIIISGSLHQSIQPDLTLWTFHNSKLEVEIQKLKPGEVWQCLLTDSDKKGQEITNEDFVGQIHDKLAHLCSEQEEQGDAAILNSGELEECDAFGETRLLDRFEINNGDISHKVMLGSDQWLFALHMDSDKLPVFCMRRDVDGIVWQPEEPSKDSDIFKCTHVHTFPAFGYIAASRQDKKFLVAPPDFSYVAIVNSLGHLIVFRKSSLSSGSVLRNRKTSFTTSAIYTQHLVNLESNSPTVGAVACNSYLFVLTSQELIMININV